MPEYKLRPGAKHYIRVGRGLRRVLPGEKLLMSASAAQALRDKLVMPEEKSEEVAAAPVNKAVGLELRHAGDDTYDVISPTTGEKINDEPVSREDAEALIANGNQG